MDVRSEPTPAPARLLAAVAVLPLVVTALQVAMGWPLSPRFTGPALFHLTIYGAIVMAFLGGVSAALVLPGTGAPSIVALRVAVASLTVLIAWAGLWIGARTGLLLQAVGLAAGAAYDVWSAGAGELPRWYVKLRAATSAVAVLSLLAAATFGPF